MAWLAAVRSDPRTAGEWICEASIGDRNGPAYESLTVHVEVRKSAGSRDGLRESLEARLNADLGLSVSVDLVDPGRSRARPAWARARRADGSTTDPVSRSRDARF